MKRLFSILLAPLALCVVPSQASQVHFRIDCVSQTLPDQFPKYSITRYSLTGTSGDAAEGLSVERSLAGQKAESVRFDPRRLRETGPLVIQGVMVYTQQVSNESGTGYVHAYQNPAADLTVLDIRLPVGKANTPGALKGYSCTLAK